MKISIRLNLTKIYKARAIHWNCEQPVISGRKNLDIYKDRSLTACARKEMRRRARFGLR